MKHGELEVGRMTDRQLIKRLRAELFTVENAWCPGNPRTPGGYAIKRAAALAREIELRGTQLQLL